jgi:hypothetical protein
MTFILTNSGKRFDLVDPKPEQVDINHIAHALSQIVRFTGHCQIPLTVAEHSIRVSQAIEGRGEHPYVCLWGLLHDAHEAYTGDISTPMKEVINSWALKEDFPLSALQFNIDNAIIDGLGLRAMHDEFADSEALKAVRAADKLAVDFERGVLLPESSEWPIEEWVKRVMEQRKNAPVGVLTPLQARDMFLTRYALLRQRAKIEFDTLVAERKAEQKKAKRAANEMAEV